METNNELKIKRSELEVTLQKYNCKTEDELDNVLWFTYGVILCIEED